MNENTGHHITTIIAGTVALVALTFFSTMILQLETDLSQLEIVAMTLESYGYHEAKI